MSIGNKNPLIYRFGDFLLDALNRKLWRGNEAVDLSGRYFDALVLLVREHGQLVEKDRLFSEVWEGVVVSDSALTQCIKDIRKQLGDDAANPRYIETVPRYGYRFIAPVEVESADTVASIGPVEASPPQNPPSQNREEPPHPIPEREAQKRREHNPWRPEPPPTAAALRFPALQLTALQASVRWSGAGTVGGGVAGLFGGLLYGSMLTYAPPEPGMGTASILVVLLSLNVLIGLLGGFGVSVGMAAASWITGQRYPWSVAGAALGGLLIGGAVKLLAMDAFHLLVGRTPPEITGGIEGGLLGAALVLGARGGSRLRPTSTGAPILGAGLAAALAGALIAASGGRLMGGSLELLARSFADSQLRLDVLGGFFGEVSFGFTTQVILSSIEGLLFGSCVAGAIVLSLTVQQRADTSRR